MRYLFVIIMILIVSMAAVADEKQKKLERRNLVRFFDKCRAGEDVTVAYIGGSVTSRQWRPFTTDWLRNQFKKAQIHEVNAAVGGTGSRLGVFRMQKDVLDHNPDLIFIEFAINDRSAPNEQVKATMEGLVRQAWTMQKKPDIAFVYVTHGDLDCPLHRHQAVADAYRIPTINCQQVIKAMCNPGYIDWQILAPDNVHPNEWGCAVYAAKVATFLKQQMALQDPVPPPQHLPQPAFSDSYQTARLVDVTEKAPENWNQLEPQQRFHDGAIMAAEAGQTIEFTFDAGIVGLYYQLRKNGGIVSCEIDGEKITEFDASWGPRYRFNREIGRIINKDLSNGEHTLRLTVLQKNHDLSDGHEFKLGYLMLAD